MVEARDHTLAVAFGSNLGDRIGHLASGVHALTEAGIMVDLCSSVYETAPVGFLEQPPFLNMVVLASGDLPPRELLSIFQSVERNAGRTPALRNGPRTLDLDLLFFGEKILRYPGLRVPHPRWKERSFVVHPLAEICPQLRDPETGLQVHEIAASWTMEPREIRIVLSPDGFQKALEEWKK